MVERRERRMSEDEDGGCLGRKTHSLSAGCHPERRRRELCLGLKVKERQGEEVRREGGRRRWKKT